MFKYVLSAFICLAFAMPAAAQCGCDAAPSCRTPKKLGFVPVKRCLPQISMKCVTDACGCSRRKLSISKVEVTGACLGLVDKDPCDGGLLKKLFSGCNKGCGCAAPAPAPCGCAPAPEPCGCDGGAMGMEMDMAPTYAEPMMYSDPVAAPAADCGCNG